ncbi:hypothetical protein A1A1_09526 [Planococcus antarcticus DSM 14505]|uniref:YpoC-like domain-containing protein n=1 Tax=Planococcus antarcticus DSM 14505 TaxID=1185653 RepID=A0A1C7DH15_9BACL|nr:hypothetical protein [Planococcus antarcticus]ANU10697.1 hypothetical protein BBH88_10425 [Planococcus antarcticus DSM 14505]EIM06785.1 hypothetical protein A1A1_09526 [Planococcus antarcticus DSM 14505]
MKLSQKLTKEQLDPHFLKWDRIAVDLAKLHSQRDKRAKDAIQEGLKVYTHLLAHCRDALKDEEFEPLNGSERLSFVEDSAGTYAAYRQLDKLFAELKKTIARKRIELKRLTK